MNKTITGTEGVKSSEATDPFIRRMVGRAVHGNTPFDVPFISHIQGNLYLGGCEVGLILPDEIEHVISLYPWEFYHAYHDVQSFTEVRLYDSAEIPEKQLYALSDWASECLETGKTLIHCQAGLNRSSLLTAMTLIRHGLHGQLFTPREAIDLIREKRSPACLCNPHFDEWLQGMGSE